MSYTLEGVGLLLRQYPFIEFRTKVDRFSPIRAYGGKLGNEGRISTFVVETRDGLVMEYGLTPGSPEPGTQPQADDGRHFVGPAGADNVVSWRLVRVRDLHGNYCTYEYDQSKRGSGEFLIKSIKYSGNSAKGTRPRCEVVFTYEDRPDRTPIFWKRTLFYQSRRLSRITTFVDDEQILQYSLIYEQSLVSGVSRLEEVALGSPTTGLTLPKTTFSWQDADYVLTSGSGKPHDNLGFRAGCEAFGISRSLPVASPGDFNGDGRWEFACASSSTSRRMLSQSSPGVATTTRVRQCDRVRFLSKGHSDRRISRRQG